MLRLGYSRGLGGRDERIVVAGEARMLVKGGLQDQAGGRVLKREMERDRWITASCPPWTSRMEPLTVRSALLQAACNAAAVMT